MMRKLKKVGCFLLSICLMGGILCTSATAYENSKKMDILTSAVADNDYWTPWMETGRYNSNAKIESLTNAVIMAALTGGLKADVTGLFGLVSIVQALGCEQLYFTTITYSSFNNLGYRQYYQERLVYSDAERTDLIDTIETEIVEEWHLLNEVEEI